MTKPLLFSTKRLPRRVEARVARDFTPRYAPHELPAKPEEILAGAQGAAALLVAVPDRLSAETIGALPASLRVIGTYSVGFEHIDLDAARTRGIAVVNTPDVLSETTAELALALLFATARRIGEGERLIRGQGWTGWTPTQLVGQAVIGQRLGIFGMGRIGRALAGMARGLRMEVHYRNRSRLAPELEGGAIYHDDDARFLASCDYLSLNAPGGAGTMHWLNAARLAALPPHAIVINAGRGTLVDDTALIAALRAGRIAGAGLDVFAGEPALNPAYLTLENAVLLPHIGSATGATRDRMGNAVLDGIDAILAGREPENRIA
jgi:lactate dehydrogenase-like 2-hydroxyacid dehydrogenase